MRQCKLPRHLHRMDRWQWCTHLQQIGAHWNVPLHQRDSIFLGDWSPPPWFQAVLSIQECGSPFFCAIVLAQLWFCMLLHILTAKSSFWFLTSVLPALFHSSRFNFHSYLTAVPALHYHKYIPVMLYEQVISLRPRTRVNSNK